MTFEDRYSLQVPLGETERGSVWNAKDAKLRRSVAVAVLDSDASDAQGARFREVWKAALDVRHSGLPRVFEVGETGDGEPFVSMELVEGESLATRMAAGPAVRVDQAVRAMVDILDGLAALHVKGVAHGDVEPGNILVKERGMRLVAKLVGLGLDRALVRAGQAKLGEDEHLVTLAYMSPAQATGATVADAASDAYSAAATLYALLTGRLPHHGLDEAALRRSVADEPVRPVAAVRPELPEPIAEVLDQALSSERAERFADAKDLAKALRTALLKSRKPGAHETPVGPRGLEPPTDEPPQPAPEKKPKPVSVAPPKPGLGLPPLRAPVAPKEAPPKRAAAKGERGAEPAADAAAPDEGAEEGDEGFERLSGLLEIPHDGGAPRRLGPQKPSPPPPMPPPPSRGLSGGPLTKPGDVAEELPAAPSPAGGHPASVAARGSGAEPAAEAASGSGAEAPTEARARVEGPSDATDGADLDSARDSERDSGRDADPEEDEDSTAVMDPAAILAAAAHADADVDVEARSESASSDGVEPATSPAAASATADGVDTLPEPPAAPPGSPEPVSENVAEAAEVLPTRGLPTWTWAAAAAAAVLAVVVVVAVMMSGDDEGEGQRGSSSEPIAARAEEPVDPQPEPPPTLEEPAPEPLPEVEPEPEPEVEPEPPEPVVITLAGVPDGATVLLDGEAIEGTAIELDPEDPDARDLEVRLEGHRPWTRSIQATASTQLDVSLEPMPAEGPSAAELQRRAERRAARRAARARQRRRGARRRSRPAAVTDPGF